MDVACDAHHVLWITQNLQIVKVFCAFSTHTRQYAHTIYTHNSNGIHARSCAETKARRRLAASYDVDGSRFNGGCNYIANEPEVETVRALLRPKERLYTLELRRSTAIDIADSPLLHSQRDGEMTSLLLSVICKHEIDGFLRFETFNLSGKDLKKRNNSLTILKQ